MSQRLCMVRGTDLVVVLLVVLFAISSWVDINGLWVELPILTQKLPEGWNLPSYMAVIIQVANIAPLAYTVTRYLSPHSNIEVPVIYTIISVGATSCLLLIFFWDATATVAGELHSVGLMALQFFLALVDCTSSVAYLPFMATFQPQYLTAYFIGEGFSGLLPSIVSLFQGAGQIRCVNHTSWENVTVNGSVSAQPSYAVYPMYETPKFSIEIFFGFLCSMLVVSLISFSLLNFWSYPQRERITESFDSAADNLQSSFQSSTASTVTVQMFNSNQNRPIRFLDPTSSSQSQQTEFNSRSHLLLTTPVDSGASIDCSLDEVNLVVQRKPLKKSGYLTLLLLTALINAISNGVLPSVQSYSCLPYGIEAYHLAVTLSSIANPVACFFIFFLKAKTLRSVSVLSAVSCVLAAYVLFTAISSPSPPLNHHAAGPFTVVLAWILAVFSLTYTKVSIASILREEGKRALLWCGAFSQIGSLVGALVIFFLLNYVQVFRQADLCS